MRLTTILIATLALGGLFLSSSARAGVVGYTFTTINVPGTSPGDTAGIGINDLGQIVGNFVDNTGLHGFLDDRGKFTTITPPNSTITELAGINNRGQILGASDNLGNFIYSHGTFTPINAPGFAFGINDRSQIVGQIGNDGYVDTRGKIALIDVPGAAITGADGINDRGQIVGQYFATDTSPVQGFLYSRGAYTTISPPGGLLVIPTAINDLGQIVGGYCDATLTMCHGFLDTNGSFTNFDDPNAPPGSTIPVGINDLGQIIGTYTDSSGVFQSFIATPIHGRTTLLAGPRAARVAEPTSLALLTVGLGGLGLVARRKRAQSSAFGKTCRTHAGT